MNRESPLKRIALVTGVNKGIGFEVACRRAARGCTVLPGARNKALGEEAAATLQIPEGAVGIIRIALLPEDGLTGTFANAHGIGPW